MNNRDFRAVVAGVIFILVTLYMIAAGPLLTNKNKIEEKPACDKLECPFPNNNLTTEEK